MISRYRTVLGERSAACALLVALVAALAFTACGCIVWFQDEPECEAGPYVIQVDSLTFSPPQPSVGDILHVQFWGTVGHDTCYGFTHFEATRESLQVDVTAWGTHVCGRVCGDAMIYLDGEELLVSPLYEGNLRIVVHQPGGAVLVDTVAVGPGRSGRET